MKMCKFEGCQNPHHCRGFCEKHATALYRGQILEDGTPLSHYKPKQENPRCRFPKCNRPHHGSGWCNLHRKWFAKGWIDAECNILRQKLLEDKPKKCKICGLKKLKGRGFCKRHYSRYIAGILDESGERTRPLVRYSRDFQCIVPGCGAVGVKIIKGMCKSHYTKACKGIIDWQGMPLRTPKRGMRNVGKKCRACLKDARTKGFCSNHYDHFRRGNMDEKGKWLVAMPVKNKGKVCSVSECGKPALSRGLCKLHYGREVTGYLGPEGYKNVGKSCSEDGCDSPAYSRTLCTKHYARLLRSERLAKLIPVLPTDTVAQVRD